MICGHVKWNGIPCQRTLGAGQTKCALHSGKGTASRVKSEQMLALARMPACEALYTIIENWERATCVTCGYPNFAKESLTTIIRAATAILDRTGMGPRATLEVSTPQSDGDISIDAMNDEEKARLFELTTAFKQLKADVRARVESLIQESNVLSDAATRPHYLQ